MENLVIEATKSSPYIHFNAEKNILVIKGESYPEYAAKFYAPVFQWLESYLISMNPDSIEVKLEVIYFNSSSSKILMNFFDRLETAAQNGKNITINWIYHEDNEAALECGEEFMEDLTTVSFNLVETSAE